MCNTRAFFHIIYEIKQQESYAFRFQINSLKRNGAWTKQIYHYFHSNAIRIFIWKMFASQAEV